MGVPRTRTLRDCCRKRPTPISRWPWTASRRVSGLMVSMHVACPLLQCLVASHTTRVHIHHAHTNTHTLCFSPAGLAPYDENEGVSPEESFVKKPPSAASRPRAKLRRHRTPKPVSFDDYHALWKGIATSLTSYQQPNSCELTFT